jgi:hypothetical protein
VHRLPQQRGVAKKSWKRYHDGDGVAVYRQDAAAGLLLEDESHFLLQLVFQLLSKAKQSVRPSG